MVATLVEVLQHRFGVAPDEFAAALVDFAERTGPLPLLEVEPAGYLGEAQQSILRSLGATLERARPGELGPVAGFAAAYAQLVEHSLPVGVVAQRLGVDSSRVRQRIYARSLYGFKPHKSWMVPGFQLTSHGLVPGLDVVLGSLPAAMHPVAVARWFTSSSVDLDVDGVAVSPIDWLISGGKPEAVSALAGGVDTL